MRVIEIRVRKSEHEKYQFQPIVIGGTEDASGIWNNSIRFMNAQVFTIVPIRRINY